MMAKTVGEQLDTFKVAGRIPVDVNEKLDKWYKKLGITKSVLISMCIQAGINNVIRAISPEESISPETFMKLAEMYDLKFETEKIVQGKEND